MIGESLPLFDRPAPQSQSALKPMRPYQAEAIASIRRELDAGSSTMLALFCGGGKTRIAGEVARGERRVMFLVHMEELAHQALGSLERTTGVPWELEKAEYRANPRGCAHVVASVQTLMNPLRLQRFAPDAFSLVIPDEVHHHLSSGFRKVTEYFTGAKRLGLTATPDRTDKRGYEGFIDTVAFRMELDQAIDEAWATDIDFQAYESRVSLDGVAWERGDFKRGALDAEVAKASGIIAQAALEKAGDLRTIAYTPAVDSSKAVAAALNLLRPGCARSIDGNMSPDERRPILAGHRRGEFQYLVNCQLLLEAYDDEQLQCLIAAAPTGSRVRAVQQFGRVTRLWPGVGEIFDEQARRAALAASPKPRCRIIDLCFLSSKHPLYGPVDILGGKYSDEEKKRARKALAKSGGSVSDALQAARLHLERRAKLAQKAAGAKVDLVLTTSSSPPLRKDAEPVTEGQLRDFQRFGITPPTGISKADANKLLRYEHLARVKGWCSYLQRQWLQRNVGVSGKGLPREKGRRLAEAWKANGKLRLSPAEVAAVLARQPGEDG